MPRRAIAACSAAVIATGAAVAMPAIVARGVDGGLQAFRGARVRSARPRPEQFRRTPRGMRLGTPAEALTISGGVPAPLTPGTSRPLDLRLRNRGAGPVNVIRISVSLGPVAAPRATRTLPCSTADFTTGQLQTGRPLVLPAGSTRTLSVLGVPRAHWPRIAMVDRPADQDGCVGARVQLRYLVMAVQR